MREKIEEIIHEDYSPNCLRATFFAFLYDTMYDRVATPIEATKVHPFLGLDCRLGTNHGGTNGTCTRQLTGRSGDYYGNCPSIHASQHLSRPVWLASDRTLCIEGGATLSGDHYVHHDKPTPEKADAAAWTRQIYRCSMCLKHLASHGVPEVALYSVSPDGVESLNFRSVLADLAALTICNIAGDLED